MRRAIAVIFNLVFSAGLLTNLFTTFSPSSAFAADGYHAPKLEPLPPVKLGPDPILPRAWHLTLRGTDAISAWQITKGSPDVVIGIIDSGIDYNNPEMAPLIARNEADCNFDKVDDDENGFIDDCVGWNFSEEQALPYDDNGHGTFIASIIASRENDSMGSVGVCPQCSILPVRFIDGDGGGDNEDAIRGIDYAISRGVKVLNLSFGEVGYDQPLRNALKRAAAQDIVIVVPACNGGDNNDLPQNNYYPANYKMPNMLTIAASRRDTDLWKDSNYSKTKVHMAAPGVNIMGLWVEKGSAEWATGDGTSFATPVAAAVAGLIRSANPRLTAIQVVSIMKATVSQTPLLVEKVRTSGVVNAARAVTCAVDPTLSCLQNYLVSPKF